MPSAPRGIKRGLVTLSAALLATGWCASAANARPAAKHATVAKQAATTAVAAPCGGTAIAKPGGGLWQCSFDDEFNATSLDRSEWTPQLTSNSGYVNGPAGAQACYVDSAKNVSESGGYLRLTARAEAAPFTCPSPFGGFTTKYTAGMVSTYSGFHQAYGRFEVRAKLPQTTARGLQETLWLWPVNQVKYGAWPYSGEIDFAEFYSQYANLDVPYLHYVYDPSSQSTLTNTNIATAYNCTINLSGFNTYAVTWVPGRVTIFTNGSTCLVDNYAALGLAAPAPFDQPFFIALTQALGVGTNAFDPATTPLPATTTVDYVRAWK